MAKHDTLSDADGTSLSTTDRGQPIVTYVRVGRGMVKVTKYEKQDKVAREEKKRERHLNDVGSVRSFDSSQPAAKSAPSIKSRVSGKNTRTMPAWMPKFRKSKKGKATASAALAGLASTEDQDASSPTASSSQHASSSSRPTADVVSSSTNASDQQLTSFSLAQSRRYQRTLVCSPLHSITKATCQLHHPPPSQNSSVPCVPPIRTEICLPTLVSIRLTCGPRSPN
jgi:hypothetical protein